MGTSAISGGSGFSPSQIARPIPPPQVNGITPSQIRTDAIPLAPNNPLLTAQNQAYNGFVDFYNEQTAVDPLAFTKRGKSEPTAVKFAYRNNSDGDRTELGTA